MGGPRAWGVLCPIPVGPTRGIMNLKEPWMSVRPNLPCDEILCFLATPNPLNTSFFVCCTHAIFSLPAHKGFAHKGFAVGTDLGLVWCRFVLGLPTDNPVISFRLANRNEPITIVFCFCFLFLSPRTEPVSLKSHSALSVHYRFGQPKPINWVIVSVRQTEAGP